MIIFFVCVQPRVTRFQLNLKLNLCTLWIESENSKVFKKKDKFLFHFLLLSKYMYRFFLFLYLSHSLSKLIWDIITYQKYFYISIGIAHISFHTDGLSHTILNQWNSQKLVAQKEVSHFQGDKYLGRKGWKAILVNQIWVERNKNKCLMGAINKNSNAKSL